MKKKIIIGIVSCVIIANVISLAITGLKWGWGPFAGLHDYKLAKLPGNAASYDVSHVDLQENNRLAGKKILFLGSSVTYGASSQGISFVDYIEKETGCIAIKEAVSGTTLVDDKEDSYISRLAKVTESEIDLVVCQVSTNDATKKKPLGKIVGNVENAHYDTHTVAGAMEHIISYTKNRWKNCKVIFYTNPKYESEEYAQMVDLTCKLSSEWDIPVIDLWNDEAFNQISEDERTLYMADQIHPTKAGYLKWWTPYIKEILMQL